MVLEVVVDRTLTIPIIPQTTGVNRGISIPDGLATPVACLKPNIPVAGRLLHFQQFWDSLSVKNGSET